MANTSVKIPRLADVSATMAAMISKEQEIASSIRTLETELQELMYSSDPETSAGAERLARTAAILGDELVTDRGPTQSERSERSRVIHAELGDLRAALSILRDRLRGERSRAGVLVCEAVKTGYEGALRDTAIALSRARLAYAEAVRITDDLWDNQGITWNSSLVQPHNLKAVLHSRDRSETHVDSFIRELVAAGIVKASEVSA